jgi:uncharacterized protein YegL
MPIIVPTTKPRNAKLDMFVLAILAVAIAISFLFVGGLTPGNFRPTSYQDTNFYTPSDPDKKSGTEQGLQLDLVKLKGCSSSIAVNFLVDRSGSMDGDKIARLKNGILAFKSKLSEDNLFGLQVYSATNASWTGICDNQGEPWCNIFTPSYFKDVKSNIKTKLCPINANGFTYSKRAFEKTEPLLYEAKNKFAGYKIVLIFISDGVPETADEENTCGQQRCFATQQDPTEVAIRIKNQDIKIITLAYTDMGDSSLNDKLQAMMKRVASSPNDYYQAPNNNDVKAILEKIAYKICQEAQ